MAYYPLMVNLSGRLSVVVGGGVVAERKVKMLLNFGAEVLVVSPTLTLFLEELHHAGRILVKKRPYQEGDLERAFLAIGATDDRELNRKLSEEAQRMEVPVNIVDDPLLSTFIAPSIVKRGDLVVAISTGGSSPALAKRIRQELEERYGEECGEAIEALKQLRERAKREIHDPQRRQELLKKLASLNLFELFKDDRSAWERYLEALFQQAFCHKET